MPVWLGAAFLRALRYVSVLPHAAVTDTRTQVAVNDQFPRYIRAERCVYIRGGPQPLTGTG